MSRPRDPGRTRIAILTAARAAFAADGLAGARVDAIAADAGSNKRMIYYYFASKDGLFQAVLEAIYAELSEAMAALDLSAAPPEAMDAYVAFVWRYYLANPDVIAILNAANVAGGAHLPDPARMADIAASFVARLDAVLQAGMGAGCFRDGLNAMHVHITTVALAYFYLGNSITLSRYFEADLRAPAQVERWAAHMAQVVRRMVAA